MLWLLGCTPPAETGAEDTQDTQPEAVEAWTEDCLGLDQETTWLCSEELFWQALQTEVDLDSRQVAWDRISAIIDANPDPDDPLQLGRRHFQRGQLAMALAIENGEQSMIGTVVPDIDRAMELDPTNPVIPTWKDSMLIATAHLFGNDAALEQALEQAWENVALFPVGNTLSISGTTIGLPLSTGAPQHTVELLDAWVCEDAPMCDGNTERAPFGRPGLAFHFGEAYARVGQLDTAQAYMDLALTEEDAEDWPYRFMAEDAAEDIEGFAQKFADLGEEGSGFELVYANSEVGCQFCHSR